MLLQQTLRHQHTAFQNIAAGRPRCPRFTSRTGRQSAHDTRSAFRIHAGALFPAKQDRPLDLAWSRPTMVIVSREPDGR